ncbi:hypothetical protein L2E82_20112 [Cichorium intybus]|uniref:Uncharacterized protein n=1 Tax=Cichorium intybus TaxID=13427 RepID=A0ACB9DS34_CICIN|nr:hypothetical protein L2E82_20112 [Cichorium intybus]
MFNLGYAPPFVTGMPRITNRLKREYEAEINAVVDYNQVVQVKMTDRHDGSELGTPGQVLKRTRVGVEDSSRAPTIESTGSAFESGVGHEQPNTLRNLLGIIGTLVGVLERFRICVSDDCSTIMMKAEDVCERISRNWDPVTGWHNLEEDIRELKQYIDVKSIRTDIRVHARNISWDHLLGGATSIVVGTTYAMGLLVLVVGTTYSVGPLLKREYEAEINAVVDYNQVVQVKMTDRHDGYTLMLLMWRFMR